MKYENYLFSICQTIHENESIMMNTMQIAELVEVTLECFFMFIHMRVDI